MFALRLLPFLCVILVLIISIEIYDQNTFAQQSNNNWKTYTSENYDISTDIPTYAIVEESTEYDPVTMLSFILKDGFKVQISMYPKSDFNAMDLKEYVDNNIYANEPYPNSPIKYKLISGPFYLEIDNIPAYNTTHSYIISGTNSAFLVSQSFILFHNEFLYIIDFRAPPDLFNELKPMINYMIESIKFLT